MPAKKKTTSTPTPDMPNLSVKLKDLPDDLNMAKIVQVVRLHPAARLPMKQTAGSACFDLAILEDTYIPPIKAVDFPSIIRTGLAFAIPEGHHMKVFLRSSVGAKSNLRLANHVGIIDSDYRGEVQLIIENLGRSGIHLPAGTRIAQFLIEQNVPVKFMEIDELEMTARGTGGIGSTGRA